MPSLASRRPRPSSRAARAVYLLTLASACGGDPAAPAAAPPVVVPPPAGTPPAAPTPATPTRSVSLSASVVALPVGDSLRLTATARDAVGAVLAGRAVRWESSLGAVVRVSADGVLLGVGAGTALVTATVDGIGATAAVTVRAAAPATTTREVRVTATVAVTGRVTARVTPELGGTLATTDAAGTRHTLAIPPGAVLDTVEVAMTPLARVDGLPASGGLLAGVRLEPDGLRLAKLATLTIQPRTPLDGAWATGGSTAAFGYAGDGADLHAHPVTVAAGMAMLRLHHFSGWGVARGTAADRQAEAARAPARWEASVAQAAATGARDAAALRTLLASHWEADVRPLVDAARRTGDVLDIRTAVTAALTLDRLAELLGVGDVAPVSAVDLIVEFSAVLMQRARERCTYAHDLGAVTDMLQLLRTLSLLGRDAPGVEATVGGCLRFDLDLDSRITFRGLRNQYGETTVATVQADDVPLRLTLPELGTPMLVGEGPLRHLGVQSAYTNACEMRYAGLVDGRFRAYRLEATVEPAPRDSLFGWGRPARVRDPVLVFDPGLPSEQATMLCRDNAPVTLGSSRWRGMFQELHADEFQPDAGLFVVRLNAGEGAVLGMRGWRRTAACGPALLNATCEEETILTVYHRPAAP